MNIIITLFQILWTILKWILIPVAISFSVIGLRVSVSVLLAYSKGQRREAGEHKRIKPPGFFKKLFVLFPQQFARDYFSRPADWFPYQGVIIYTGRQGAGKTVALVEQTLRMQHEYPSCKCISNLNYAYQNKALTHWRQLIDYKNGHRGVIVQMDETQNWFSSNQSKNFPPELLEVITQNRKNRRVILGTVHSFNRLSKPLREQTTEVRKCMTIAGCLTFVHRQVPELDSQGEVVKWKHRGFYWFVHTPEIRESYDTYHVIESLAKSGFIERAADTNVTIVAETSKSGKR